MIQYILHRLLHSIPVLFGVTVVIFLIVHLMPGDAAMIVAGVEASPEEVQAIRSSLGLDKPIHLQYINYIGKALTGDFGISFRTGRPVLEEIGFRYTNTLLLGSVAALLACVIGIILGTITATREGGFLDNFILTSSLFGLSMPTFFLGIILMLVFSVYLGLLPLSGMGTFWHLILPAFTLAMADIAIVARVMRSSLIATFKQDYIRTARAKGLPEAMILKRHAIRNAIIPVITIVAMQLGGLLGGAVITETVFAWPGIGRLIIQSLDARDFPVIQAAILILSVTFVILNMLADVLYQYIDPRISLR